MLDEVTKKDIEKISYEVLKQSKSFDTYPTPVDKILDYTNLVVDKKVDLLNIERSFLEKLEDAGKGTLKILQSGLSKVKGIFFRTENTIYIDASVSDEKQNFVKLHEAGHGVLTWQNEIALAYDNDTTLLEEYEDQFEAEANYFASITLFQQDRFHEEMLKLDLSIDAVMVLAKKFGASVHSTLRNYTINSKNSCALLVLTPIQGALGNGAICTKRNLFHSPSFSKNIGNLDLPDKFGYKWKFIQLFRNDKKFMKGEINLPTVFGDKIDCNFHYFYNGYNVFVFLFPKGEKKKSRTKIILTNLE